jgi:hypothetical protein
LGHYRLIKSVVHLPRIVLHSLRVTFTFPTEDIQASYQQAQEDAKTKHLGLWADPTPIRNGLSLIIIPGIEFTLSAHPYTMGDMFHGLGYATTIRDFRTYAFVVVLASRMYAFVVVRPSGNGYENNKQTCHHQGPKKG